MSNLTPHPALPRQPLGKTFVVSMIALGAIALIQVFGLMTHYAGEARKQIQNYSTNVPTDEPAAPASLVKPANTEPALPYRPPSSGDGKKFQKLMEAVDHNFQLGDYETALKSLDDLEEMQLGDPSVPLKKAAVLERLDKPAEAMIALKAALSYPESLWLRYGLTSDARFKAEKKFDQLSRDLPEDTSTDKAEAPTGTDNDLREGSIQPGSNLGIVDIRMRDVKPGVKGLRVAVKSLPGSSIDVKDVKIVIYFYEQSDEGDINITNSKPISQWLSPPIDWANNEPELLEMQYTSPSPGDPDAGRKYYGYIVGIYYNGELQDFRADPIKLAHDFALPLYLKQGQDNE